jgi:hypothetical protein
VKTENWSRFAVERFEIHQYMTLAEYQALFGRLGFVVHAEIGTPRDAQTEWRADFELLDGLAQLPEKRITLLAIKQPGIVSPS